MKHRQAAEAETDGATDEEPAKRTAADPLARRVGPRGEECHGEQQAQEIASRATVMERRTPCAYGITGEEKRGEKCAGHRL